MSFIIGKKCEGVCDTACIEVCPVDCIHGPIDIEGRGQEVQNCLRKNLKINNFSLILQSVLIVELVFTNVLLRQYMVMKRRQ